MCKICRQSPRRLRKQREEGLILIRDGLKVQLNQAIWHLGFNDLSEKEQMHWKSWKNLSEYWLNEVQDAIDGKLHF